MEPNGSFSGLDHLFKEGNFNVEDQIVHGDSIGEFIQKYLFDENMTSFYEETSLPLAGPEIEQWPGQVILPVLNDNQDFMVPDLDFLVETMDGFTDEYDDVEPEEELLSILQEIITEDEKNSDQGYVQASSTTTTTHSVTENAIKTTEITTSSGHVPVTQDTSCKNKRKRPKNVATEEKRKKSQRKLPPVTSRTKRRNKKT